MKRKIDVNFMDLKNNNEPAEVNEAVNNVEVELSEEAAEGIYSNLVFISHSSSEFVLDFARMMPGVPKAKVKSRIVLTPDNAMRLLGVLQDNLMRFEAAARSQAQAQAQQAEQGEGVPLNFGGAKGEA